MALDIVNQDSTAYLTVTPKNKSGVAEAPDSMSYRIDCLTSAKQILDDTALVAASSVEITLTPTDNAIQAEANAYETKIVTVTCTYGASDGVKSQYHYKVRNLSKVPSPT